MMSCHYLEPRGLSLAVLQSHLPIGMAWEAFRIAGKRAYRWFSGFPFYRVETACSSDLRLRIA